MRTYCMHRPLSLFAANSKYLTISSTLANMAPYMSYPWPPFNILMAFHTGHHLPAWMTSPLLYLNCYLLSWACLRQLRKQRATLTPMIECRKLSACALLEKGLTRLLSSLPRFGLPTYQRKNQAIWRLLVQDPRRLSHQSYLPLVPLLVFCSMQVRMSSQASSMM